MHEGARILFDSLHPSLRRQPLDRQDRQGTTVLIVLDAGAETIVALIAPAHVSQKQAELKERLS
jgi:hypothetical protein